MWPDPTVAEQIDYMEQTRRNLLYAISLQEKATITFTYNFRLQLQIVEHIIINLEKLNTKTKPDT